MQLKAYDTLDAFFDISNNICETRARDALDGISRNHLLFLVTRFLIDIPLYALHVECFTTLRRNDRYASVPTICIDVTIWIWRSTKCELYISLFILIFLPVLLIFLFFVLNSSVKNMYLTVQIFLDTFFLRFHERSLSWDWLFN